MKPRITLALIAMSAVLVGCGSIGALQSCKGGSECASYALVSEGKATGLAATIAGGGSTCKVTVFGDISAWTVSYNGESCSAKLNGDIE